MKYYILYVLFFIMYSCDSKTITESEGLKLPNDIRWVTNSSEYKILCEQIYENAWNNLSEVLQSADSQSVIIMDLDETVLDNSKYQIDLTEKGKSYNPESWSVWVNQKEADLVPGAKKFIDLVRSTNVRIVFLSNRMAKNELPTIENMETLDVYEKDDIFMLRIDRPDKKHIRRSEVLQGTGRMKEIGAMKVLAYFGDARHDFPAVDDYYNFGKNMFMFANPMYGKW